MAPFCCTGRPSSGAPRHLLPSGRREEASRLPRKLIPAARTHAYPPLTPPDQGGCREASCGRAGLRVSPFEAVAGRGGGGADRHRAGESGRATRGTDNQKAIWRHQRPARGTRRRPTTLPRHDVRHRHRHAAVDCDATSSHASPRIRFKLENPAASRPVGAFGACASRWCKAAFRNAPALIRDALQIGQPCGGGGVARRAPVAARRERAA